MKWMARPIGLFVALMILLPCLADGALAVSCGPAPDAVGEFQTASLEQAKLDPTILCSLDEKLNARKEANVHAVVVLRGGRLVFEAYRNGDDWKWGTKLGEVGYTPSKVHDTQSVSKSIVSLLIGVAIDRKQIKSVDESVFSYFPEYREIKNDREGRDQAPGPADHDGRSRGERKCGLVQSHKYRARNVPVCRSLQDSART